MGKQMRYLFCILAALCVAVPGRAQDKDSRKSRDKKEVETADQPPLKPYFGPLKRAAVTMEVKVQGVTTTAPTSSGTTTVVTIDIQQPTEFGTGLSDMLTTALVASKRFVVMERLNLEEVNKERALGQGAEFNPATALKGGKLMAAQVIVRGAVTEFSLKRSGSAAGGILGDAVAFSRAKAEAKIAIDLKLIDVATGQVIDSVRAEGKAVSQGQSFSITKEKLKLG